jgi:Protein of unknown function (DUF1826)
VLLSKLLQWTKPAEHYYYASAVADLAAIQQRPINIAIHERKPPMGLKESIHSLVNSSFIGFESTVRVDNEVRLQIERRFVDKSILPINVLNPLIEDMELLIYQFAAISRAEQVRVHLKTIVNDACRKFHIDGYDLRLLCSYAGPGTEWTYNENVNRKYLGEGTNEQIVKDWGYINQLKSYDVVILKGELPHKRTGNGIVHRSPAIEQTREQRLVLRIDY